MAVNKMRNLIISIAPRLNVATDNSFTFNSNNVPDYQDNSPNNVYALSMLTLNYSILTSNITSTLVMSMNQPLNDSNVLRSGQYITITDNGETVFEGVLLNCMYMVTPMAENSQGGTYFQATLAPSIYQFTLLPTIFDVAQAEQIQKVTGVNITAILAGTVVQKIDPTSLFTYMLSNSDYSGYFNKSFDVTDLGDQLYLMASTSSSRDSVIRQSIDVYNCVFYQKEDGQIVVKQLDYSDACPFSIDIDNQYNAETNQTLQTPIVPMLSYEYQDNAYSTPIAISNYAFLTPDQAVGAKATPFVLTYAPNPKYFPRLQQLAQSGWFVGTIGNTQINNNITSDPTIMPFLKRFVQYPDNFLIQTQASGIANEFAGAYQSLLTAKDTANAVSGYASFLGTVSLDDPNIPNSLGNVVGKIIQLHGLSNLPTGIIASCTRSYSSMGSYLTVSVAPPGSYTGAWKNSNSAPAAL